MTPAELTAEAREAAAFAESASGSLARYLPSVEVDDIVVEVHPSENGLVEEAQYRAYSAEPEFGGEGEGDGFTIKLPALGQKRLITEYQQLRNRNAGDDVMRNALAKHARAVGEAIVARAERQRAIALLTGKTTITGRRFNSEDDFGRAANHTQVASALWDDPSVSRLDFLLHLVDVYAATNGFDPARMVFGKRVQRALTRGNEFATALANGGSRPASVEEVRGILDGAGLPDFEVNDRRTSNGLIIPDNVILFLPEPGPTTAEEATPLGATFWGRTLTSMSEKYQIMEAEQPGIVVGAHTAEQIPHNAYVDSDAIALPVLANANLTLAATVL